MAKKITHEDFVNKNIEVLGVYTKAKDKIKVKCKICSHEWEATPNNLLRGKGCPICKQSHGEEFITNYLKSNNIEFIPQYSIEIDTNINISGRANIDFYIPSKNLFIEYNGIQHYIKRQAFGGRLDFERQQKRDWYVRDYCKKNNIRLLEIPYTKTWEEVTELLNITIYE